MNKFSNIDLNLLKLFASLYQTGSVTLTAEELNLSQSACSHALQRLRDRVGDELFVRVDNRMLPTEYSTRLSERVLPGLAMLRQGLETSSPFCPDDQHTFRIAATDFTAWCMQPFTIYLSQKFNGINIEFIQLEERLPELALKSGELDLVCGYDHQQESSESIARLAWFEDSYVGARCHTHPVKNDLTLAQFLASQHVLVAPWNESRGIVDLTLSKMKKKRQIAIKIASLLAAPYFVQNTPYLLALPKKYAIQVKQHLSLTLSPLPLKVPDYQLLLYWHKTRHNDPKIKWFIEAFSKFHEL
jgi:DNA-binding transcriptional LysR family regulator